MTFGIVVYPGSNCEADCFHVLRDIFKAQVRYLWHKEKDYKNIDCIIIPGGFSYGDYLRPGAIAAFSPISEFILDHANALKPILGICNGFQILLEMKLLKGAMIKNNGLKFCCKNVFLKVENKNTLFTNSMNGKKTYKIPIAHIDGSYFANEDELKFLEDNNLVVFRYTDENGNITTDANPNGSVNNIAGIINKDRNILGMMPHPERCCDELFDSCDGKHIFQSIIESLK